MKVAVTGARGFVGRYVLAELARRDGIEIVATERPDVTRDRPDVTNVRWVALDMAAPLDAYERLGRPDVVLHLAWGGLPNYRALTHFELELPQQYGFLGRLVRDGLPSLVTVGTCFEYGQHSGPLAADRETAPSNPYGFAKDTLHRQLRYLKSVQPFDLTWARLFYMHGEGQPGTSLYPLLKAAVAAGHTEFPMSGGEQLRDYLPVAEVARRLVDLATSPTDCGPLNICSGEPISVRRLVETWIAEHGWTIKPVYGRLPYPDYEPMAFWGVPPAR